eukprot:6762388-Pyramimonas_sp.AAC.1
MSVNTEYCPRDDEPPRFRMFRSQLPADPVRARSPSCRSTKSSPYRHTVLRLSRCPLDQLLGVYHVRARSPSCSSPTPSPQEISTEHS